MYNKSHNMLTFLKNIDASQISVFKHHLDSLISITKAIESIDHLDELLKRIMHCAITVTGAARGFLFLSSHNKEGLTLEVMRGVNEELRKEDYSFETYRVSEEIIKLVENTGRAVIGSQKDSNRAQGFSDLKQYGINEALCVPFKVREKTLGFLYLDHTFDNIMFRLEELELMKSFTTLASLYIENSILKRKLEKRWHKNISITMKPGTSVSNLIIISIKGILDSITMKHVDEKIMPIIEHKGEDILIDLSNLEYASKTGIMCLMKYLIFLTNKKKALKFVKPPQHVFKTLEIVGIAKKIDMYDNIEAAIGTV